MFVAEVVGSVWATEKHPSLEGKKLMLVQPVEELTLKPAGELVMAIDFNIGAGPGDIVVVIDEGNACRDILGLKRAPARTIIGGIIDSVYKKGRMKKYH